MRRAAAATGRAAVLQDTVMAGPLRKAIVLAAGRGTRMRDLPAGVDLTPEQAALAARGLKTVIPFDGHPFIAFVLSALADAGFGEVCVVVGAGADPVREVVTALPVTRLRLETVVQAEPLGSAHALLAAEHFAADDDVAVINADNFYPPAALGLLHGLDGCGVAAFRAGTLTTHGNVTAERIAGYALLRTDGGRLADVLEKPDARLVHELGSDALVSMTCWRFTPAIVSACRAVTPSPRGELELPDAVRRLIAGGTPVHVAIAGDGVLDLSTARDIPDVARRLRGVRVHL